MSSNVNVQVKMEREPNWTGVEESVFIDEMNKKYELLLGSKSHTLSVRQKEGIWLDIANTINSSGTGSGTRSIKSLKTKWKNVKKRSLSNVKRYNGVREKTGGGLVEIPKPVDEDYKVVSMIGIEKVVGLAEGQETLVVLDSLCPGSENSASMQSELPELCPGNEVPDIDAEITPASNDEFRYYEVDEEGKMLREIKLADQSTTELQPSFSQSPNTEDSKPTILPSRPTNPEDEISQKIAMYKANKVVEIKPVAQEKKGSTERKRPRTEADIKELRYNLLVEETKKTKKETKKMKIDMEIAKETLENLKLKNQLLKMEIALKKNES